MVDLASVPLIAGALKTAVDTVGAIKSMKGHPELEGAISDLQQALMAAQSGALAAQGEQFTLMEKIRELEAKVAEFESWENEKARYELRDFGGGTYAYELKEEAVGGETGHLLCTNCFQKKMKSILQFQYITSSKQKKFKCMNCDQEIVLGDYVPFKRQRTVRVY